jgi:murein DD-endopeptidase MepM/ murein hydrolase activator NlpD
MRTLGTVAALSVALGACNTVMGARDGTMEYPGSGAGPNAVPVYVVKERDTVESLSQRYGVPTQTIIDRNKLKQPYTLRPGQSLEMPGARYVPDDVGGTAKTAAANPNAPAAVRRESLTAPGQGEAPRSAAPAGEPTPLSPASQSVTVPATLPRMAWPVNGKVVSNYGTSGGQKNDGIDIAAAKGTPVTAADGGEVIYAGSDVAKMGNLLLIQHSGGYITAYGNNEELLVKKGARVKKGQTIAKVGNSGGSAEPYLHFEVRRAGKTIDPATVLPKK